MTAGSFISSPCPLCYKPLKRPLVRVGQPVKAGLTFVEGWGLVHPECGDALRNGTVQSSFETHFQAALRSEIEADDEAIREEMDDDYPSCEHCGGSVLWEDCTQVGCEDGYVDMYEDDPLWYSPGDVEACDMCEGKGGWWICLSSECPKVTRG